MIIFQQGYPRPGFREDIFPVGAKSDQKRLY